MQVVTFYSPGYHKVENMADHSINKCSVNETLKLISGKWKACIICHLMDGPVRYGKLSRIIPEISRKMLSQHLGELKKDGIIQRKIYDEVPPKVEYSLTRTGEGLKTVFSSLESWGMTYLDKVNSINDMISSTKI